MIERLREIVGSDRVRAGDRTAATGGSARAAAVAVVTPAAAEQAAEVLAAATAEGWTVEPVGCGTRLRWGRPRPSQILLSAARLTAVGEYEPADLTIGIGAGLTHATMRRTLEPNRQWLPLDPPGGDEGTLGATVAMAASGPLRAAFGTPRDHVLGLTLVTGDGRVLELGGRVVKNVAGYDLVKLVTGSYGTLGLITRLHLRLYALPERDTTLSVAAADAGPLIALARRLRQEHVEHAALELIGPAQQASWRLLIRLQGPAPRVSDGAARVRQLAGVAGATPETAPAEVWLELSRAEASAELVVRLADRPAALAETLELATSLAADLTGADPAHGAPARLVAHAGEGLVRLVIRRYTPDADRLAAVADAVEAARRELVRRGGTLILGQGPPALLEAVDPWGAVGPALRLMKGLKAEFDPAGILAPGRFVV